MHGPHTLKYTDRTTPGEPTERFNGSWMKDVRRELKEGIWPITCGLCKQAEQQGGQSMRQIWNSELSKYSIPIVEVVDPADVKYMSAAFSNKCNSKCMTCSPVSSTLWAEEFKIIWPSNVVATPVANTHSAAELYKLFPNVEHVSLLGGEPTVMDEHDTFVKGFISTGQSANIQLTYVTNLTGISDELISDWGHFKHVSIMASIDGIGLTNDYIRYPVKWGKVETNLRKLLLASNRKLTIGLSCTASMFNCGDIADLFLYWHNICKEYNNSESAYINIVVSPAYTACDILSDRYRFAVIDKLKKTKDILDSSPLCSSLSNLIDKLVTVRASDQTIINAKHFISESDKFRNRHIKDYLPEVWEDLFNEKSILL